MFNKAYIHIGCSGHKLAASRGKTEEKLLVLWDGGLRIKRNMYNVMQTYVLLTEVIGGICCDHNRIYIY